MAFRKWREAYRRHKQYNLLCNEVLKIAHKYQSNWPARAIQGIEEYFLHGEAALALEDILALLYETRIEPTEEEKRLFVEMAEVEKTFNREYLVFWPEAPPSVTDCLLDLVSVRRGLLSCMLQLLKKRQKCEDRHVSNKGVIHEA